MSLYPVSLDKKCISMEILCQTLSLSKVTGDYPVENDAIIFHSYVFLVPKFKFKIYPFELG